MKKIIIKICPVIIVATLIISAAYLTGFDIGGNSKVFAAYEPCSVFKKAQYNDGTWAYEDYKWNQKDKLVGDEIKTEPINGVRILDYHGTDTNVVVPEYIDGKPVVSVSSFIVNSSCYHYESKKAIESVTLPSTLREIGENAFAKMPLLKTINIPANVETIDDYAFQRCFALESVIFNESEGKGLTRINPYAFYECSSLTSLEFPDSLKVIDNYAFRRCSLLSEVEFNEGLYRIGNHTFGECNLESVELKDGIVAINGYAFAYNYNLVSINLPESLEALGGAFLDGTLVEYIDVPHGLVSIGPFLDGSNIKDIVLPPNFSPLTQALLGWTNYIESLTIEDTDIEKSGLGSCFTSLKTLTIKGTCKIDANAFDSTKYVPETIIFTDEINNNMDSFLMETMGYYLRMEPETGYYIYTKEYSGEEKFAPQGNCFSSGDYTYDTTALGGAIITDYNGTETGVVTVPDSFINEGVEYPVVVIGRKAFEYATATEIILPETVEKISSEAFWKCENLTKTNLPDGIKVIEPHTYNGCAFTEIKIPDSVVFVGDGAFANCHNATEIVVPSSVKVIGSHAFFNIFYVTSVTLNEGLEKIGTYAFANSSQTISFGDYEDAPAAYSLTLPSTINELSAYAFDYSGISGEIVIPNKITKVSEGLFNDCRMITSVVMHNGITELEKFAFAGCYDLNSAPFPSNLEIIGDYAFQATGMVSVTFPSTLTHLGRGAYQYTETLTSVTIPGNIKTISSVCFFDCRSLKTVIIEDGVEYIDTYAFSEIDGLDMVVIPPSMIEIANNAFWWIDNGIDTFVFNAVCNENDLIYYYDDGSEDYYSYASINTEGGRFANILSNRKINKFIIGEQVKYLPTCILNGTEIGELIPSGNLLGIGEMTFEDATISELTLPENLEQVNISAFKNTAFETLNYNCRNCVFTDRVATEINGIYKSPFYDCEGLKNIIIGDTVEVFPDFLFCSIPSLESVHIPEHITSLGKGAFAFSGVKTITGMAGITDIDEYAFYSCSNLTQFDITNLKITDIGNYVFANTGMTSFNGGTLLESVGDGCFAGCASLTDLDLGTKIMLIGNNAFEGCTSLKNLVVPDTVKDIGDRAFADCPTLETVYMSVNVNFIPTECFYNNAVLSSFTWESASKLIGRLAFGNCTSLNTFNFIGIEKLYESSFFNSGVMVVSLGEALNEADALLEEIQASSFQNCAVLETVSIGGNIETVSNLAFAGCSNLEVAIISDNVTEIADNAFDDCPNLTFVCSETSYAYSYASANGIPVSTLVIAPIPNKTYTGYAIRPAVTVTFSGSTLTKDIDFSVSYSNNTNVGQATVNVNGKGAYEMLSSRASFTIVTRNISKVSISAIKDQNYTGKAVEPSLTITDNGRYLTEGKDYRVSYYNNTSQGTASVTISGIGNYSGTVHTSFKITELDNGEIFLNWLISIMTDFFAKIVNFFSILR